MKKAFLIGIKDLKVAARDRAALVLMLAAPFVLTLGMGLITGNLGGGTQSGLQGIPVILVDHDDGDLSQSLVEAFASPELEDLIEATQTSDESTARSAVEEDAVAAAVIIPAGFSESIIPTESSELGDAVSIEIYANPARPISSGVVEAIVQQFLGRVERARVAGEVAVTQLLQNGLITTQEAPALGRQLGSQAAISPDEAPVSLAVESLRGQEREEEAFNPLAVLAPGMAIFFLMYTVTYGGTRLLNERNEWTLQRLLTTPTGSASVLGGKVFGIFLTGFAQLVILTFGANLLFGLNWGDPWALLVIIAATVFGATGWGLLLAALAQTPFQVSSVGTAMMLLFGILGGSFISAADFPPALRSLRLVTPNAWALDALAELAQGATLSELTGAILALLLMGLALSAIAIFAFRQRQVFA